MNGQLYIFLLSILPLGELRLTIPLALEKYQLSFFSALVLSVAGVMTAVLLIFLLLDPAVKLLRKIGFMDNFFNWLFERTRSKHGQKIELWGGLALAVIAAIPIPVLGGGWTAALVGYLFDLDRLRSFLFILFGTIISGFIVLSITQGIGSIL